MASKHGIAVSGGVIDADYTGEIKVRLPNHGSTIYEFKASDPIAQLIVQRIQTNGAIEIEEIGETEHGKQEFSTSDVEPKRLISAKE